MNYGMYVSASGVLTNLHRQDVAANNLANATTVGFRRDLAAIQQRAPEAAEDSLGPSFSHALLDRLGGGVFAADSRVELTDGPMTTTGNELDLAIRGPGFFVLGGPGDSLADASLTRDGRFTLSADNRIVSVTGGRPLLSVNGSPITIDPNQRVEIGATGEVRQGGAVVAQVHLIAPDANRLRHLGQGLYEAPGEDLDSAERAGGTLHQRFLEQSNVNSIMELTRLIDATKAATGNANMIRYHDTLMDRAVNVLGRVA